MLLAGRDQLERGHAIHRIVVIHPVHPALVALMHAVDPDIPWHPIRLGRSRWPMGTPVERVWVQCRRGRWDGVLPQRL